MTDQERDEEYMRAAIEEAVKGKGKTFPNPVVGAVIISGDEIIAKGYHEKSGGPHAEVVALESYDNGRYPNAEMYVTLEPCSTQGRTGSCCAAIIQAQIKRVIFGSTDLNPIHNGRAVKILQDANIDVTAGVLKRECDQLNDEYFHQMRESNLNQD